MCNVDTQAPPGYVPHDFRYDEEDPYGPIKSSLEKTVELLQFDESIVRTFLVQGHKKLVIQTRAHPRPTVLLRRHAETMYEASYLELQHAYNKSETYLWCSGKYQI